MSSGDLQIKSALVVPFFNESERINNHFFQSILDLNIHHLIFVDDGSSDKSFEIISHILGDDERIMFLRNERNLGKSEALRLGFLKSLDLQCNLIITSDADGAVMFEDIRESLELAVSEIVSSPSKSIDPLIVSGARVRLSGWSIERSTFRQWIGRVIATLVSLISRVEMYDPQSPLRVYLIDIELFKKSLERKFSTRWFSEVELILRLSNCAPEFNCSDLRIYEFPMKFFKDIDGGNLSYRKFPLVLKELYLLRKATRR